MDELIQTDEQEVLEPVSDETDLTNENEAAPSDAKVKELLAQKKHWRDKAIDPKTGKTYKALLDELKAQPKPSVDTSNLATKEEVTDIKLGQMGFDVETATHIKALAKGLGKNPLEVLDHPLVKTYVDTQKKEKNLQDSIPGSSSRTVTVGQKSISEMSDKELKANWNEVVKAARR